MKKRRIIVFLLLCCGSATAGIFTKDIHSYRVEQKAEEYELAIKKEIEMLGEHEWAGRYYHGDGLGVNVSLLLAPESGFLFEWHGCLGLYDRNYGSVKAEDGVVRLSCKLRNERKGLQGIAEELVSVSWGGRRYLIASDKMIEFCNHINAKREPRYDVHGFHLLKTGDEEKDVPGEPNVSEAFKKYLLKNPVNAEIIDIRKSSMKKGKGNWKTRDILVTLDAGRNTGLLEGMELYVTEPNDLVESVIITKVDETTSEAKMRQMGYTIHTPQVGWRLSTETRWAAAVNRIYRESIQKKKAAKDKPSP